ncbi:hypothetical protein NMG29_19265 [Streptomyces cocklensis]|uniref:HEPN/Toprim N-terminal domain-containing protein n=1 Tax=Actinacidiphila cocklensis TaxID=887465 RepID=A0A9W4GT06_9ACTN|nr:hypothetical protein [Actinacidiphila cocklensis]MDD1060312.1 hypothetical protein [Actinacidiphila cocklensis]CAG6394185.1 conserved hypothetical protein [Actinacidiphila cocklensis]
MSSDEGLWVGGYQVSRLRYGWDAVLLAAFTDEMLCAYRVGDPECYSSRQYNDDDTVEYSLRGPGKVIAERLHLLGYSQQAALELLEDALEQQKTTTRRFVVEGIEMPEEFNIPDDYGAADWLKGLAAASRGMKSLEGIPFNGNPIAFLRMLDADDPCLSLRATLLAMPNSEVVLIVDHGRIDDAGDNPELSTLCSEALDRVQDDSAAHAPVVVLTEGHSDVAVLQPSLAILYPHLTNLIRFMDYSNSPRGGAGALVNTVRAFAAARIANPVIALFDNDTAAADALRPLDRKTLPSNIKVLQYPPLDLASHYPTLGPPTADAPSGHSSYADVNGTAGSIELYLGRDVLTLPDGSLRPVHWRSYIEGTKRYQGEITGKKEVQDTFQAKLLQARSDPAAIPLQDWSGIRSIIDLIVNSAF